MCTDPDAGSTSWRERNVAGRATVSRSPFHRGFRRRGGKGDRPRSNYGSGRCGGRGRRSCHRIHPSDLSGGSIVGDAVWVSDGHFIQNALGPSLRPGEGGCDSGDARGMQRTNGEDRVIPVRCRNSPEETHRGRCQQVCRRIYRPKGRELSGKAPVGQSLVSWTVPPETPPPVPEAKYRESRADYIVSDPP
jgi:hypothetical protein